MIGHNSAISAGHLRATILGWRAAHPDVEVDGVEADRGALLAGLDTGEIDIAILVGEANHADFRHASFWNERVMIALPDSHVLAGRETVHWTDLRGERFLLPGADPGPEIRDILLGRLMMAGEPPDIRMHQASREAILSVLGGGLGVSIICEGGTGARYPDVVIGPSSASRDRRSSAIPAIGERTTAIPHCGGSSPSCATAMHCRSTFRERARQ
ncbi:LysR family substrate-binding domain-containing protein [Caballeronia sp. PC1]|uniref:LysR family substrate-binding domain-containing protein n=1 Tax=Caballeronia sp. PC1 TaxID=2906765 RepID=UPI001F3DEFF9|nr:LysR family substrate-binding domain-containing protein [Caballeronia sp. PC1]MCE4542311.1 LysR family substrate-binding domain-containing protein [Caballeronia sp. PC1]